MERHHIIPRCIGGTNDEENLIYLFPYEHYYAHKKLAIENEDNIKLARAWWLMSHIKSNDFLKTISAEEYAEARILFSKKISEEQKGNKMPQKCIDGLNAFIKTIEIKVVCVETNQVYNSFCEAGRETGIHSGNIRHAAYGERESAGGFHWRIFNQTEEQHLTFEEKREKMKKSNQYKTVICNETGEIFESLQQASISTGIDKKNISAVANGKRKSCKGLTFDFIGLKKEEKDKIEKNKEKLSSYKYNKQIFSKILCEETGEVFNSQQEACLKYKIKNQNLSAVLVGRQKTAKGFHWRRVEEK